MRVASWNVWSSSGPWQARVATIEAVLRDAEPDLVALQEVWRTEDDDVWSDLAADLGLHYAPAMEWYEPFSLHSGTAMLSRWPITRSDHRRAAGGDGGDDAVFHYAEVSGPRGAIDAFVVMLDWRPGRGQVRQQQVRALHTYAKEHGRRGRPTVVCGDFNATPDSDEIRMLTGRAPAIAPWFVFYDAWEIAGETAPGYTWSNRNKWAAPALLPDRRIDYILSGWPRAGGVGHPTSCVLMGTADGPDGPPSDHYGVIADLRY